MEDIDGQMVQLLAGNISTHVQQLRQLGLTSLKAHSYNMLLLNQVSTCQSPALPRVVTIKGKVDKKTLSKEQSPSIHTGTYVIVTQLSSF